MRGKFRKRPVVIEAMQYTGIYSDGIKDFLGDYPHEFDPGAGIKIATLEGVHLAQPFDWLIRGVAGEVYPCKPLLFGHGSDYLRWLEEHPEEPIRPVLTTATPSPPEVGSEGSCSGVSG